MDSRASRLASTAVSSCTLTLLTPDNSPWTQVFLVGFVCFSSVGMSSAISNLGAGGMDNITLSNIANAVLYAVFAITGRLNEQFIKLLCL